MLDANSRKQLREIIGASRLIEIMVRTVYVFVFKKTQDAARQFISYDKVLKELKNGDCFSKVEFSILEDMLRLSDALAHGYFFGASKIIDSIIDRRDDLKEHFPYLPSSIRPGLAVGREVNGSIIEDDSPHRENTFFTDYFIFILNGYLEKTVFLLNEANSFVSQKLDTLMPISAENNEHDKKPKKKAKKKKP